MTERYVAVAAILDQEENRVAPFPLGYDVQAAADRFNAGVGDPDAITWVYAATAHLTRRIADLEERNRELTEALESARLNGAMAALGGKR